MSLSEMCFYSFVVLFPFISSVFALPGGNRTFPRRGFKVGTYTPQAFSAPSPNENASHVLHLSKTAGSPSHGFLRSLQTDNQVNGVYGITPVNADAYSLSFVTPIQFNNQEFQVIVDTSSSDTWVAGTGFQCVDVYTQQPVSESQCRFGPLYQTSSTFQKIPNESFNIGYGDGEFLTGVMGTERVTLAGITVNKQEVGIANLAGWYGDGLVSGLLGLAFPALTSAYSGNDPSTASGATQIPYNPIFTNMYSEGSVPPVFSLAIDRDGTGMLALGGLAPIPYLGTLVSAPFRIITVNTVGGSTNGRPTYSFYAVNIDAILYQVPYSQKNPKAQMKSSTKTRKAIVDSGTTLNYFPNDVAGAINAVFSPAAQYDSNQGAYVVKCDAEAPIVGITIGGRTFFMDPEDLIIDVGFGGGYCLSGIIGGGSGPYILGDVFLKNVIAVFDVGASEMRFAARFI